MAIDHRLNFFGIYLQSADIDDSIPSAKEVVAVSASFHHVTCVYESLLVSERSVFPVEIAERGPGGTDPKRTVVDLHFHGARSRDRGIQTIVADHARGEAFETIIDFKSNTGFRGSKGMAETGLGI